MSGEPVYLSIRLPRALVMRAQAVSERTPLAAGLGICIPDKRTADGSHVLRLSRRLVIIAALELGLAELAEREVLASRDPRQLEIPRT